LFDSTAAGRRNERSASRHHHTRCRSGYIEGSPCEEVRMSADSSDPPPVPVDRIELLPADAPLTLRPWRVQPFRPPVPRFGSAHMLLWIGCTGVYLATNRDLYAAPLSPLGMLVMICQVLPRGAAWAGLVIFSRRRWRKVDWPIEPGEWLVAITGLWLAVETASVACHWWQHFQTPAAVVTALTCLLLVWPTLAEGLPPEWRLLFSFFAMIFAWPLLAELLDASPIGNSPWLSRSGEAVDIARFYLAAAALAVVVCRDHVRAVRHGWLHWAGLVDVVLVLLSSALGRTF
jgi:hypothetical protein